MWCSLTLIFLPLFILSLYYLVNVHLCMRMQCGVGCDCLKRIGFTCLYVSTSPSLACRCPVQHDCALCHEYNWMHYRVPIQTDWMDSMSANYRVHTHSLLRHWARRFACFFKGAKCADTGNWFWSSDLVVMSPARFPCAIPVNGCCLTSLKLWRHDSVKHVKCADTGGKFRSYVLRVMSPARSRCATPVSYYRV